MVAAEKFGIEIYLCGPEGLIPPTHQPFIKKANFDDVLPLVDAVMMLRIQFERNESLDLDAGAYYTHYGLTPERVFRMKKSAIILHPGPFNRGVEIGDSLVEHPQSRIFKQMANGVFTRMAILEWAITEGNK